MEYWIDPPAEKIHMVFCPKCGQEAFLNDNFKIECNLCARFFNIPEQEYDFEEARWLPN
jgi:predicted nucleic-acid-binding Zn-ribbon protein